MSVFTLQNDQSRQSTPFTLGIEGCVGTGKSSLMQRLRDELSKVGGVETVWFNAWTAKDQEALEVCTGGSRSSTPTCCGGQCVTRGS